MLLRGVFLAFLFYNFGCLECMTLFYPLLFTFKNASVGNCEEGGSGVRFNFELVCE